MINLPPRGHRSRGIVAPYALRRPAIESGSFYAVVHGEEVGVYGTWYVLPLSFAFGHSGSLATLGMKQRYELAMWLAPRKCLLTPHGKVPSMPTLGRLIHANSVSQARLLLVNV